MVAISSPQYVWALLVQPLQTSLQANLSVVQVTFAVYMICQSGIGPLHGELACRVSARYFAAAGGLLIGISWISSAFVTQPWLLYITYGVLSGIGTGWVYVAVIELMLRWFPQRRGLAVGLVAACYGLGAIVTTFPISWSLDAIGLQKTFIVFGVLLGAVVILCALGMKRPGDAPNTPRPAMASAGISPSAMLRTPIFWWMFVTMALVATGGLMAISQLGALASHFGISKQTTVWGMAALPLALTIDRIANGVTRPLFGWVSDRIGRENTMFVAFILEAAAIYLLLHLGANPVLFVLLSAVVFFGWGEIYSLFPSLQADIFGTEHAARNFGWLLVATAIAAVLAGPLAAWLYERLDSWDLIFHLIIGMDIAAALIAVLVLKRKRAAWLAERGIKWAPAL